jgi:metallo-beta-lactamase class B
MRTLALTLAVAAVTLAQPVDGPFPPHKIAGNLYYVGSQQYSSYLVTTPEGHILINSSFEETVPLIRASIEKLGFKFADVKILLNSHAHGDHIAGNFLVKELTGAKIYIMKQDVKAAETGRWKPFKIDHVLEDKEKVTLGGATLIARLTPGHTEGCTTWTMVVEEGGKKYDAVVVGSPNVNPGYILVNNTKYPGIAGDYRKMFAVLKSLKCDIFLGAHGAYYGMDEKYQRWLKGEKLAFVDPQGYKEFIAFKEKEFQGKLEAQQRAARQ